MSYNIKITKTVTTEKVCNGEWTIVRTEKEAEALTDEKIMGSGERRGQYGYAPPCVIPVTETHVIYEQTLENLDVAALVCSINGGTR